MPIWRRNSEGQWEIMGFPRTVTPGRGDPYKCVAGVSNLGPVEGGAISDAAYMMHHGGTEESAEEFRYLGGYAGLDGIGDFV